MDLNSLLTSTTVANIKALFDALATAAQLQVTAWYTGSAAERLRETVTQTINVFVAAQDPIVRGQWLDLSYDPGDIDPFDPGNEALTPAPGRLSALGENQFGTTRADANFATGTITITNGSGGTITFFPFALTFQRATPLTDGSYPTYTNTNDASIYVNSDGSVTMLAAAVLDIPIQANVVGTDSDAVGGEISILVTAIGGGGVTVSNAAPVLGSDREDRDLYIAQCQRAASRLSFSGPADAYKYFATKTLDGDPLENANDVPVAITRVYASDDSPTGETFVYFASKSGAADAADVTAANTNIQENALIIADCISYTGAAASEVSIHVSGSVSLKARPGVTATDVKTAILTALASGILAPDGTLQQDGFETFEIGGYDQVFGAGYIYTSSIEGLVKGAFAGIYDVTIATPAGASTALALGEVATLDSVAGDWTINLT